MEEMKVIDKINKICGFECVTYCKYSMAFFAYVPFDLPLVADKIKELFEKAGFEVISGENATGDCFQISAYV